MKKNITTIIILALVVLNVVLTSLMVFVMMPAFSKMNNVLTEVAAIINLEKEPTKEEDGNNQVAIGDLSVFSLDKSLQINLKSEGSKLHYAAIDSISISMNTKAQDYKVISENMESNSVRFAEIVTNCLAAYTLEEANAKRNDIKKEVLDAANEAFQTTCFVEVSFGNLRFQ